MASEILGLFTSPEMYQRQQDLMMQRQAADLAQLDPYQSARYGAIRAGQQFGRGLAGLAGLLGAEDPQLRMISARQSVLGRVDLGNPDSILAAARQLANAGDQQGALALADYARKAQADAALVTQRTREGRAAAVPKELQVANARAGLLQQRRAIEALPEDAPNRAEALQMIDDTLAGLPVSAEAVPKFGEKVEGKSFELFDKPYSQLTTAERKSVNDAIRVEGEKPAREPAYGTDREATAQELYGKNFGDLTQTQKAAVNKRVDEEKGRVAEKGAPRLPGQNSKEGAKDIPGFRDKVINTIDPFRKTVTSADLALQSIQDALKDGNFISFNAARTQLAKALGDSSLSRRDIEQAGGDPSILGGISDKTSTLFTGTPTKDTQRKIQSTLKAIRSVAAKKARDEIANQKKIATRAGFTQDDTDLIFNFPEFEQRGGGGGGGGGGGKTTTRTLKSGKTYTVTED
jgi:hypothetical protein